MHLHISNFLPAVLPAFANNAAFSLCPFLKFFMLDDDSLLFTSEMSLSAQSTDG